LANVAQKVLEHHVYTQMRREVNNELSIALGWKYGFGLAFMGVEWEQQRAITDEPFTVEDLVALSQQLDLPELMALENVDGKPDESLIGMLQALSPILATDDAKRIVYELRNEGASSLPVLTVVQNKPRWLALLPCVDVIIPSETWDVQRERFVSRRELVIEAELEDRINSDGYDADFVEEAKKHKGEFSSWLTQPNWRFTAQGSERDMIELHHFLHKNIENGTPQVYRTVFNDACVSKGLFAVHKPFEYNHNLYPLVAMRRSYDFRPLLTSIGISEEAYTDEGDIKAQQDGMTDRTELINSPPMVVPLLRAMGARSQYGPRAIMPALRPNEVTWPPLPPSDNTPVQVIQMVQARLDRRYSVSGPEVDPQMKVLRQQEIADETHGDIEQILEQTLKLSQQFDTDEFVQRVAGNPQMPWNVGVQDIAGEYEISVSMDMRLSDMNYVKEKMQLFQVALGMNQAGTARLNKIFDRIMGLIEPDAADLVESDQQDASQKEIDEEDAATAQILVGMEPRFPQSGNHKLRLQRLISNTFNSQNPAIQQTIQARPDIQKLLFTRIKNHQNQIQQYEVNPGIGATVSTRAFTQPAQPAEMTPGGT
jgi:hypothetical protein